MDNEKYAKVIVKNNTRYTDNLFTYKIPEFLVDGMQIGHRVLVPFGKGNKPIEAYVFSITDEKEVNINYKEIFDTYSFSPLYSLSSNSPFNSFGSSTIPFSSIVAENISILFIYRIIIEPHK